MKRRGIEEYREGEGEGGGERRIRKEGSKEEEEYLVWHIFLFIKHLYALYII